MPPRRKTTHASTTPTVERQPENLHIALLLSRSQITCSLRAPLWFKQNRCENVAFAAFFRFYLFMLPLMQRWACLAAKAGVPFEGDALAVCHINHGVPRLLDPVALHAIAPNHLQGPLHRAHLLSAHYQVLLRASFLYDTN